MNDFKKGLFTVLAIVALIFFVCLLSYVVNGDDDGIIRGNGVTMTYLVTHEDLDYWQSLRNVERCDKLDNDLVYCAGCVENRNGYVIVCDAQIKEWSLSNNKGLVDLSRYWQNQTAVKR